MSATERLRELLDERGVEYDTDDEDGCEFTEWMANGLEWEADSRGELVYLTPVMLITPEQAIAATLGPGTCHNESKYPQMFFCCSECGCAHKRNRAYVDMPRFCPNCGRRVEVVE